MPIQNLRVFGKSEQVQTTGAQLLPQQEIKSIYINNAGTVVGVGKGDCSKIIENTKKMTYYIFRKKAGTRFRAAYVDAIPTGTTNCSGGVVADVKDNLSISVPAGKVLIINMENESSFDELMVQEKSQRIPYEPYTGGKPSPSPEYPQEITIAGEGGTISLEITGDNAESQTLILPTPNGLPGIKVELDGNYTDSTGQQWITDEIDLERGKYIQRVKKVKPLKQVVFNKRDENGRCSVFDIGIFREIFKEGNIHAISSIAKWSVWGNKEDNTFALGVNGIYYKDSTKTLEEVNTLFEKIGTNFEVCGVLKTSVEHDLALETISSFKSLHTNYPTTSVSNNGDAEMELTYIADTKSYIDQKIEPVIKSIVNTQIALL